MDYLGQSRYVGILEYVYEGITFYFIDNESYFWGDKPYGDWYYDLEKFSFFSQAALSALPVIGWRPDVIHCHDWQTGLIPVYLKGRFGEGRVFPRNQVRHDDPQPEIPGRVGCKDDPEILGTPGLLLYTG